MVPFQFNKVFTVQPTFYLLLTSAIIDYPRNMGRSLVISCAAFSAIGGFLFGYDSGIASSTIAQPQFIKYFEHPSDAVAGGIVSAFQGMCLLYSPRFFETEH
jgi:hypothetical protein